MVRTNNCATGAGWSDENESARERSDLVTWTPDPSELPETEHRLAPVTMYRNRTISTQTRRK